MTLVELLRFLRSHALFIAALTLVGGLVAFGYVSRIPPTYMSDASGYVVVGKAATPGEVIANDSIAGSKADSYLPLLQGRALAKETSEILGGAIAPEGIVGRISGEVQPNTVILKVYATGSTPEEAQQVAGAASEALARVANRLENGGEDPSPGSRPVVTIIPIDDALPGGRIGPDVTKYVGVGLAVGAAVPIGLVFLRRQLDTRVRTVADVEEASGSTVLGVIPITQELRKTQGRGRLGEIGQAAESFRQIRTNLRFVSVDEPPRAVVVTSAAAGDGKSTISSILARSIAESGEPTIVIDGDLRRSSLAKVFELHGSVGLSQVLAGQVDYAEALQETDQPNLHFLASGRVPPNPSELLGSQRMTQLIDELRQSYFVVIDAPPLLPVTDAGVLSRQCDGTIFVFAMGRTHKEQVELCAKTMERIGGRILGCVINLAPRKAIGNIVYGYGAGYTAYKSDYDTTQKHIGKLGTGTMKGLLSRR